MERRSSFQRIVIPVLFVMGTMILSIQLYDFSRHLQNRTLHLFLSHFSALFMFLSIWLGAFFANSLAFFKGASFGERVLVCLATPVVWSAKILYGFFGIFSGGEFLFLFFHHLILGPLLVALLCMALAEIGCRLILRRKTKGASDPVFAFNNTILLIVSFILVVLMLWNGGHSYYYLYLDLYSRVFL